MLFLDLKSYQRKCDNDHRLDRISYDTNFIRPHSSSVFNISQPEGLIFLKPVSTLLLFIYENIGLIITF